jgi:hypothetical protein
MQSTLETAMSALPNPDANPSSFLVPKGNRPRFILYFVAVTTAAGFLSLYPSIALQALLGSIYPSNPVQPNLPDPLGLLDILFKGNTSRATEDWVNWYGLLRAVAVQTVLGVFTGLFQWSFLRQHLSRGNWLLATILGYQLAGLLASNPINPAIYYSLVCRGVLQWLILRQVVRDSWIWLLAHPLAFLVATAFGFLLNQDTIRDSWVIYSILLGLAQSAIFCTFQLKSSRFTEG